jgi:hypothetical protein
MNWQALGAIGEFVGGLLVVFSLLYLALQLRQNTRALRADTHQQWVVMNSARTRVFASGTLCRPRSRSLVGPIRRPHVGSTIRFLRREAPFEDSA